MKLSNLTILVALILTACPTVRCYGFIETVFDNLQTQSTITRNVATKAEQDNAKQRADALLKKHANLNKQRYILVKTTPKEDTASTNHQKPSYIVYDTQTRAPADKYVYSNIDAPINATVTVGNKPALMMADTY